MLPSSKRWAGLVFWGSLALIAIVVTLATRNRPDDLDKTISAQAKKMGPGGADYVEAMRLLAKVDKDRLGNSMTNEDWARLLELSESQNHQATHAALSAIAVLRKSKFRDQVWERIEKIKTDDRKKVRDAYIHFAGVSRKPGWREEARQALNDPNPEVRERAKAVLDGIKDEPVP